MQLRPFVDYRQLRGHTPEDKLPDYSYAGYKESSVPLPTFRRGNEAIQATDDGQDRVPEINAALARLASQGGGVLQFSSGTFVLESDPLRLNSSNLHLMGETRRPTVFKIAGPARSIVELGRECGNPVIAGAQKVSDAYVPVGATSLRVDDPKSFAGREVIIERTISRPWLHEMEMDHLVRDGKGQTWLKAGSKLSVTRSITAISVENQRIFFDIPLTDSAPGSDLTVSLYTRPQGIVENVGISDIQMILQPSQSAYPNSTPGAYFALTFHSHLTNAYSRNLYLEGFLTSININPSANRITLSNCHTFRSAAPDRSKGYAADFTIAGNQVLLHRCKTNGVKGAKSITVMIQSRLSLCAVVEHKADQGAIQPHQRWATGVLIDTCEAQTIEVVNRASMGTGHGWTAGNTMIWNSQAENLRVHKPPTSQNYCVGSCGKKTDVTGLLVSDGQYVQPRSLFAAQLEQRIGKEAADRVLGTGMHEGL